MRIEVNNISKRYGRQTIIRNFSYIFETKEKYLITGANGSGKSTLLKMLSGYLTPDSGKISYFNDIDKIVNDNICIYSSFSAPYISIPQELTVAEAIAFNAQFKPLKENAPKIIDLIQLSPSKKLSELSSGMKQRLHLGLVCFSTTPLLFLDEPTSFFDKTWKKTFQNWISEHTEGKTIILCSNDEEESIQFNNRINL